MVPIAIVVSKAMVTDLVDFDEHPLPAWENFPCYDCVMMPPDTSPAADETTRADIALEQALVMARPLVTWLLRSGIGFGTFTTALKPVFLAQAGHELGEAVDDGDDRLAEITVLHAGGAPKATGTGHVAAMGGGAGTIGGHGNSSGFCKA